MAAILKRSIAHVVQIFERTHRKLRPLAIIGRAAQLVSANPGLNFNSDFFSFLSKALSRIIFSIFFSLSNHQIVGKENSTELAF